MNGEAPIESHVEPPIDAAGSVAVVTGGANGIGRAIAIALLGVWGLGGDRRHRGATPRSHRRRAGRPGRHRRCSHRRERRGVGARPGRDGVRATWLLRPAVPQRGRDVRWWWAPLATGTERLAVVLRGQRVRRRHRGHGVRAPHDRRRSTRSGRRDVVGRRRVRSRRHGLGVRRLEGRSELFHRGVAAQPDERGDGGSCLGLLSVGRPPRHRTVLRGPKPPRPPACSDWARAPAARA